MRNRRKKPENEKKKLKNRDFCVILNIEMLHYVMLRGTNARAKNFRQKKISWAQAW